MERIKDTVTGVAGMVAVGVTPDLMPPAAMDAPSIVQTVIQVIIGLVTLFGLLKKKRPVTT